MDQQPHPDYVVATSEDGPPTLLISTLGHTHAFFHCCPHSQTYEAYSVALHCTVWLPLPCKQWSCRFCAQTKIASLARRCETAKPNRLMTLTVDPKVWDTPRDAFDGTRRHVPELCRQLRRRFGELEYLRVTELTKGGWPHYHMLVRSGFLPQPVVKDLWAALTKATIVDLRKVENQWKTYLYLVKYLAKMHNLEWTKRHVSYSKGFFPKPLEKPSDKLQLRDGKVLETHPATLAYHQFRNNELVELTWGVFALNPNPNLKRTFTAPQHPDHPSEVNDPCLHKPNSPKSASNSTSQSSLFSKYSSGS